MNNQKIVLNAIPHALLSSIYTLLATVPLAPWLVLLHAWITDDYLLREADEPFAYVFGYGIALFIGGALCLGWLIPFSLVMAKNILKNGITNSMLISVAVLFSALAILLGLADVNFRSFWEDSLTGGTLLASIPLGIFGLFLYFKLFARGLKARFAESGVKILGCRTGKTYAAPIPVQNQNSQGKRYCRVRETAYSAN